MNPISLGVNHQLPSLLEMAQNFANQRTPQVQQNQNSQFDWGKMPYLMAEQGLAQNNGSPLGALAQMLGSYWMKGGLQNG